MCFLTISSPTLMVGALFMYSTSTLSARASCDRSAKATSKKCSMTMLKHVHKKGARKLNIETFFLLVVGCRIIIIHDRVSRITFPNASQTKTKWREDLHKLRDCLKFLGTDWSLVMSFTTDFLGMRGDERVKLVTAIVVHIFTCLEKLFLWIKKFYLKVQSVSRNYHQVVKTIIIGHLTILNYEQHGPKM